MDWSSIIEFVEQNHFPILVSLVVMQLITWVWLLMAWRHIRKRPAAEKPDMSSYTQQLIQLEDTLKTLEQKQVAAVQQVGFYRYNAFPGTGGELSFSLALLDGEQEGFVITSLYGRQDARVYAKEVKGTTSPSRLSPEEKEAIRRALSRKN